MELMVRCNPCPVLKFVTKFQVMLVILEVSFTDIVFFNFNGYLTLLLLEMKFNDFSSSFRNCCYKIYAFPDTVIPNSHQSGFCSFFGQSNFEVGLVSFIRKLGFDTFIWLLSFFPALSFSIFVLPQRNI